MTGSNFTDIWGGSPVAKGNDFEPIETGKYEAQIVDTSIDMVKGKVSITFEIAHSLSPENQRFVGRKCWGNYTLNEKGIPFLKADLSAIGLDVTTVQNVEGLGELLDQGVGINVEVFIKSAKGRTSDKIFTNVYINGLANATDIGGFDKEDKIPF